MSKEVADLADSDGKVWATISAKVTVEEKAALELLARKLITTSSRLQRFAVVSLLLRQRTELQKIFDECFYSTARH
jgi:hypothetical protein